ncbi:Crp/Fnr family transcriptional regulator [Vibrio methylphosphonaticus]|uniref:Crp/Fnr family transcriptional regulator n=1 Tax=Vibrio methylphosphonaticus TaxID=2946866 RepID=UPI002029F2C6|nr:Crp/Fnr family transcriptional regulator [Vibrio methylphosphonaticus]MCL9776895.1 Crp/Fnr family transcriptional regulator [Vibrio methylphosphonaticus]
MIEKIALMNSGEESMTDNVDSQNLRWTTELSSALKQQLVTLAKRKQVVERDLDNSRLINQGVNFLEQGTLAVCIQTPNLKTANCIIIGKGGWFGNYIDSTSSLSSFVFIEIEPCTVVNFNNEQLRDITKSSHEIYKWFYSLTFESRAKWLQSQLINSEALNVRVVYQILEILAHLDQHRTCNEIAISQQQLSEMTGIARQRVNEVMKQLERARLVELNRSKIIINDVSQLSNQLDGIDLSIRDPRHFL